jgi:hypothetical protein
VVLKQPAALCPESLFPAPDSSPTPSTPPSPPALFLASKCTQKTTKIEPKTAIFQLFFTLLVEFNPDLLRFFVDLQMDFIANYHPLFSFASL